MHSAIIVGNFTLDDIVIGSCHYSCIGGPPSYAGLFLSTYKLKLTVVGCYGHEASMVVDNLMCRGVNVVNACNGCQATARFRLEGSKKRYITVIDPGCRITGIPNENFEYSIINGVCKEIDLNLMKAVRERSNYVYLDVQGLLRKRKRGMVEFEAGTEIIEYLNQADVVKVNASELEAISGVSDPEAAYVKIKPKAQLLFSGNDRVVLVGEGKALELEFEPVRAYDGVGMGDIFGAGFILGKMISDEKLGIALGHAAAIARPKERGIFKVPHWRDVIGKAKELEMKVRERGIQQYL